MGKESTKQKGARAQRHDPLHVQLADMPENNTLKKAPRQKFVDRNNRAEETGEVTIASTKRYRAPSDCLYVGVPGRQALQENPEDCKRATRANRKAK